MKYIGKYSFILLVAVKRRGRIAPAVHPSRFFHFTKKDCLTILCVRGPLSHQLAMRGMKAPFFPSRFVSTWCWRCFGVTVVFSVVLVFFLGMFQTFFSHRFDGLITTFDGLIVWDFVGMLLIRLDCQRWAKHPKLMGLEMFVLLPSSGRKHEANVLVVCPCWFCFDDDACWKSSRLASHLRCFELLCFCSCSG